MKKNNYRYENMMSIHSIKPQKGSGYHMNSIETLRRFTGMQKGKQHKRKETRESVIACACTCCYDYGVSSKAMEMMMEL